MKCSFLIANYNGQQELLSCLETIYASTEKDFEVIVVDNASMDDSIIQVKAQFPDVRVFSLRENKGVPYALNHAAKQAQGEFLAVLHVDTRLTPAWLENAVKAMYYYENVFAVAGLILKDNNTIDSAGYGYAQTGYPYKIAEGRPLQKAPKSGFVMGPSNAAALYRREFFEKLGGFDADFFYCLEDADLGLRAAMHGYETVYTPEAVAYHSGHSSSGGMLSDFTVRFKARNTIYIRHKNLTGWMRFKFAWHLAGGERRILKRCRRRGMDIPCRQGLDEAYDTIKSCPKMYKGCRFGRKGKISRRMFRSLFRKKTW